MLKLQTLYMQEKVFGAAIVVPSDEYSRYLGSNHASVTTAARDLSTFSAALSVPVVVIEFNPPTE